MNQESKIVSFSDAKKRFARNKKADVDQIANSQVDIDDLFDEIMKKNLENKDKASKERLKANKSVLRSYRIKDK